MKIKDYSPEFREALDYCKKDELFVGVGNPNAKILIIGKEINDGTPSENEDPLVKINADSVRGVTENIAKWSAAVGYDLGKIKTDIFRDGKNPTWNSYQKLVDGIVGHDWGRDNYDFLDHCFMSEMSDIRMLNSDFGKGQAFEDNIEQMRKESVRERAQLLAMPFFRNFPVVIMACGHYPATMNFDIEEVFGIDWTQKKTLLSTGNFYNEHYGPRKIVIHTRQMSSGVSDSLIAAIAALCRPIYDRSKKV